MGPPKSDKKTDSVPASWRECSPAPQGWELAIASRDNASGAPDHLPAGIFPYSSIALIRVEL